MNGQEKDDEIAGTGNIMSAQFWEYDTRLGRRWNIDPVTKEFESPYACFNGNPILESDENGDDGGTAALIFAATQEAAAVAAATGIGAPAAVVIEAVGTVWGLIELLDDAPVTTVVKPQVKPINKPKIQVHTADDTKAKTETKTASPTNQTKNTKTEENKGRGKNNRKPNEKADGDHSTINENGNTTYKKNDKNPTGFDEVKRVDKKGAGHKNSDGKTVETPHVHENGKKDVRPAKKGEDY